MKIRPPFCFQNYFEARELWNIGYEPLQVVSFMVGNSLKSFIIGAKIICFPDLLDARLKRPIKIGTKVLSTYSRARV